MKELSIEEKAKRYDEASKWMEGIYPTLTHEQQMEAEAFFPELKGGKDERIRKALHIYLDWLDGRKDYQPKGDYTVRDMIAWLEKQSEHANFRNKIQIGDKVTRNEAGILVNISQLNRVAKPAKRQGGQKSTNKVEPKFREGDFITDGERIFQIKETVWERNNRNDGNTYCESLIVNLRDGVTYSNNTDLKEYHLWTIQDAKDGDVLATKTIKEPFIFKGLLDKFHPKSPVAYCGIDVENEFMIPTGVSWWTDVEVEPATKEQRDLLFQKMHDAGYEWDAEKKELKNIEQKPTDEEMKETLRTEYEKGRADVISEMQNHAWSEEDEEIYQSIIDDTVQENQLNDKQTNWLKSLKDRYTWKPSDEQNIYKNGVYQETNGVRIWHNGHTFLVPKDWNKGKWPLLNKKGEENSKQNKEHLMSEIDALLDWDFVAATKHIQDLGTDIPLKDGEYLITAPVWLAMYEHRIALNKALSNIGAMEIDFNEDFWFAERYSVGSAWFFYGAYRSLYAINVASAYQVGAVSL